MRRIERKDLHDVLLSNELDLTLHRGDIVSTCSTRFRQQTAKFLLLERAVALFSGHAAPSFSKRDRHHEGVE